MRPFRTLSVGGSEDEGGGGGGGGGGGEEEEELGVASRLYQSTTSADDLLLAPALPTPLGELMWPVSGCNFFFYRTVLGINR